MFDDINLQDYERRASPASQNNLFQCSYGWGIVEINLLMGSVIYAHYKGTRNDDREMWDS